VFTIVSQIGRYHGLQTHENGARPAGDPAIERRRGVCVTVDYMARDWSRGGSEPPATLNGQDDRSSQPVEETALERIRTAELQTRVAEAERKLAVAKREQRAAERDPILMDRLRDSAFARWIRAGIFTVSLGVTGAGLADARAGILPDADAVEVIGLGMGGMAGSRIGAGRKNEGKKGGEDKE
jgi:hypothetical protein